jgi:hypothetical protein
VGSQPFGEQKARSVPTLKVSAPAANKLIAQAREKLIQNQLAALQENVSMTALGYTFTKLLPVRHRRLHGRLPTTMNENRS